MSFRTNVPLHRRTIHFLFSLSQTGSKFGAYQSPELGLQPGPVSTAKLLHNSSYQMDSIIALNFAAWGILWRHHFENRVSIGQRRFIDIIGVEDLLIVKSIKLIINVVCVCASVCETRYQPTIIIIVRTFGRRKSAQNQVVHKTPIWTTY